MSQKVLSGKQFGQLPFQAVPSHLVGKKNRRHEAEEFLSSYSPVHSPVPLTKKNARGLGQMFGSRE